MTTPDLREFVQSAQTQIQNIKTCLDPSARRVEPTALHVGLAARHIADLAARAAGTGMPEFMRRVDLLRERLAAQLEDAAKLPTGEWINSFNGELILLEKHLSLIGNFASAEQPNETHALKPSAHPLRGTPAEQAAAIFFTSPDILELFVAETQEHLTHIRRELWRWEQNAAARPAALADIRRRMHTLKGTANLVGFAPFAQLTHRLEELFERLHSGALIADERVFKLLNEGVRRLENTLIGRLPQLSANFLQGKSMPAGTDDGGAKIPSPTRTEAADDFLTAVENIFTTNELPAPAQSNVRQSVAPNATSSVRVELRRFEELKTHFDELLTAQQWLEVKISELSAVCEKVQARAGLTGGNGEPDLTAQVESQADRPMHGKVSELDALSRELNVTRDDLRALAVRQNRAQSAMLDALTRLRLAPLSALSSRLQLAVNVAAQHCGKKVALQISGAPLEFDARILETLAEILLHLVGNAVIHGIEEPADRHKFNKPECGIIALHAEAEANEVVIRIADDGAGLNPNLLRAAALRRKLHTSAELQQMSEAKLYELIFVSGFSSAQALDEFAGRGVGLDVVQDCARRLNGKLEFSSAPRQGCAFTFRFPLLNVATQILLLRCHSQTFGIPANCVLDALPVVSPAKNYAATETRTVFWRNENLPVIDLRKCLTPPPAFSAPETPDDTVQAIIIRFAAKHYALLTDSAAEIRPAVIEDFANGKFSVPNIAGATLLRDGTIVPILHIGEIVQGKI